MFHRDHKAIKFLDGHKVVELSHARGLTQLQPSKGYVRGEYLVADVDQVGSLSPSHSGDQVSTAEQ